MKIKYVTKASRTEKETKSIKLPYHKPERGDYYGELNKAGFILAQVEADKYCLIGLTSGNRWDGPTDLQGICNQLNKYLFRLKVGDGMLLYEYVPSIVKVEEGVLTPGNTITIGITKFQIVHDPKTNNFGLVDTVTGSIYFSGTEQEVCDYLNKVNRVGDTK